MENNYISSIKNDDILRYSRQMLLPDIGKTGQLAMKKSSVLIVGLGGLGCPVSQYLTGAGIGKLGLVDYDQVDVTNLHRQILHSEQQIGIPKCRSALEALQKINSNVDFVIYPILLKSDNAIEIIKDYDIIVDATDNAPSRYLLSDCCVLLKKPLVSGSALQFEGQLTVYVYKGGPCYRCLFPIPPNPSLVNNCSESGVLGPGIIGSLQALEVIKIITAVGRVLSQKMLIFNGLNMTFKIIHLRNAQKDCSCCGNNKCITQPIDYEIFCGISLTGENKCNILSPEQRISVEEYADIQKKKLPHLLLDVRPHAETAICSFPQALQIPLSELQQHVDIIQEKIDNANVLLFPVFVICHNGNDSQKAVVMLQNLMLNSKASFKDIIGGLTAWAKIIEPSFPLY